MLDGEVVKITEVITVIIDLLTRAFSKQMWLKRFKTSCVLNKHEASKQYPYNFELAYLYEGFANHLATRSHKIYNFRAR